MADVDLARVRKLYGVYLEGDMESGGEILDVVPDLCDALDAATAEAAALRDGLDRLVHRENSEADWDRASGLLATPGPGRAFLEEGVALRARVTALEAALKSTWLERDKMGGQVGDLIEKASALLAALVDGAPLPAGSDADAAAKELNALVVRLRDAPAAAVVGVPTTLVVDGKPFRCPCGCNVFKKWGTIATGAASYTCNACGGLYEGDRG